MAFDGRKGASLPQASSTLNPSPRPPKTSIKARYEVQEIVQETATRRSLRRLRTNLRHQNPAGRSAPKAEPEEPQPIELNPTRSHQVLGVPLGASRQEVSQAYKKLAFMHHPDRVAGMGPEAREYSEEWMKALIATEATGA
jgi:DnaJ-domain-containing protein 1